ncbi:MULTISPECIES: PGF-CTERM sorting domain-containing protein [Natrialbaceae]|uniref:PGF-CTERM sorting domain-containing protein n=1 Tax=Natrialbaceae TaxID=1644061 RepID=UPI00207C2712|nr:PGF-CTERM sorting domain-containing protein [Natronococcus sp. CG52]
MQFSKITTAAVALALLTLAVGGFAAIGAAEETDGTEWEEIGNSTVETTNETEYVELDLEFAEEFTNTGNETVELTIYDETEYNDSEIDETPVLEDTVIGSPNETVTNEYSVGTTTDDELDPETEYRAIIEVEHDANHIVSGFVAADDESIGGAQFGTETMDASPGFGVAVAIAAIASAGALAARRGS